jgi:nitroreductase
MEVSSMELNTRHPDVSINEIFINRWSPRSFKKTPIASEDISRLFEAARWAPSGSNNQPWRFIYASSGKKREKLNAVLMDSNKIWASEAPLLILVFCLTSTSDGREIRTAQFDTGAAWMSLAIQARYMGLYTHAMGGIHRDKAIEFMGKQKSKYESICAIAVGYKDNKDRLSDSLKSREIMSQRMLVSEFVFGGEIDS